MLETSKLDSLQMQSEFGEMQVPEEWIQSARNFRLLEALQDYDMYT